ncbi:hypothetical protein EXE53_22665, partial [Halorubrum sp. SD626R]|uniref:hypothetical protein n=1 Tax=Halorubrum sp. SD626R TaxID=1419722 RepID=UPI0010F81E03
MTGASRRKRAQAVLFSAIMVLSMVAVGVGGLAGSAAGQSIITVDDDGGEDYESIQNAIDNASSDDIIEVSTGTYNETLRVPTSNLTIRSVGDAVIAPTEPNQMGPRNRIVDLSDASETTFSGFTVQGLGSESDDSAIYTGNLGSNAVITDNKVIGAKAGIIAGTGGEGAVIERNEISNTVEGITLLSNPDLVNNNTISESESGLKTYGGDYEIERFEPSGNEFVNNNIHVDDGSGNFDLEQLLVNNNFDRTVTVQGDNGNLHAGIFGNIQPAVNASGDGDLISVSSGTYNESVTIDTENITLQGPNAGTQYDMPREDEAKIRPAEGNDAFQIGADNVEVSGFDIQITASSVGTNAVYVTSNDDTVSGNATIRNNIVTATGDVNEGINGVFVPGADGGPGTPNNILIEGNEFDLTGAGDGNSGVNIVSFNGGERDEIRLSSNKIVSDPGQIKDASSLTVSENVFEIGDPAGLEYGTSLDVGGIDESTIKNNEFNAPNTSGVTYVSDTDESLNLSGILGTNTFDRAVTVNDDGGPKTGIFGSIQPAVDAASDGDTVSVRPGTHNESVTIDTPNVTLESAGSAAETTIAFDAENRNPAVEIEASNVTVDGFTVERTGGAGFSQAVAVRATDEVTVANNTLTGSESTGEPTQGVLITDNSGDQAGNTDTTVTGNDIDGFDHGVAISTQAEGGIDDAQVESNTIRNGVIGVKFSDYTNSDQSVGAQVSNNTLANNTHGVYIFDDTEGPATTNPEGVLSADGIGIVGNDIVNNSETSITHLGDGELEAPLNYFDGSVSISGDVLFDPVLTTSTENVEADSIAETTEYGSVLELESDGERALAVGFPAPPEETAGEIFTDLDVTGDAFVYDNAN